MKTFLISLLISTIVNPTWSPDSSRVAFTSEGDLYVVNVASSDTLRLTSDGSRTVYNGYASWVYYEEIFGRSSNYRAFWWSPDSRKIAYWRFDDTSVPVFPIYSPSGQSGSLRNTRYPKAGQNNPGVEVRIVDLDKCSTVTAFDNSDGSYFGTPFWSNDSRELFVSRMPRRQNTLDLFSVNVADASSRIVYHEEYPTWINWIEGMLFTRDGLYMARDFESGWQQIYYLGYDGTLKCLTDGCNWDINLLKVLPDKKLLWFTAKRDSRLHPTVYSLNLKNGRITMLTDPGYWVKDVKIAEDGRTFTASFSNSSTPWSKAVFKADGTSMRLLSVLEGSDAEMFSGQSRGLASGQNPALASGQIPGPEPEIIRIQNDGYDLYGLISYPEHFDPSRKYPVLMEVYGGPGTAYVRDRWGDRDASNRWCWENGIIYMVVDPRSAGENGRKGMDEAFRRMTVIELDDYIAWAAYMQSLPYVDAAHIGVDGFSFGGTTTAMLVLRYPQYFCCGIAGGGVYDWTMYDSVYTERFMDTPQANPDGYAEASVLHQIEEGISPEYKPGALKLTHGTGDDNVHFQNTLRLVDALQRKGVLFDLMIYPDGMHGYRGAQHEHDALDAASFWKSRLLDDKF